MKTMWAYEWFAIGFITCIPVMVGMMALYGDSTLNHRVREIRKRRLHVAIVRLEIEALRMLAKVRGKTLQTTVTSGKDEV